MPSREPWELKPCPPKTSDFPAMLRDRMLRGVDILNNAVKVTLGPKGRNVILDNRRRAAHHQRRCRRRQRDRAGGQVREHGLPDGA